MSPAVLDVVAGLRSLLEPDPDAVTVDETGAEPKAWGPGTLYCYPVRVTEVPFETSPAARQDFEIAAVFTEPSDESALRAMDPDLSVLLDNRLAAYLAAVRANATTSLWGSIRAAMRTPPRTLHTRSVALSITGWRAVGG